MKTYKYYKISWNYAFNSHGEAPIDEYFTSKKEAKKRIKQLDTEYLTDERGGDYMPTEGIQEIYVVPTKEGILNALNQNSLKP